MAKQYILKEGSLHEKFLKSRTKIQIFGGGFGNGKTSAMVVKALQIAEDYPGMNGLMARSTYPKLNDTLRKTFLDFCPAGWIDSFALSKNSDNTCKLKNGSAFNFRYIAQRKSTEDGSSTSNLLSATYDLVVVDQIEDPEITYKDFLDILGRLRGDTRYRGQDESMPLTGPRWFLVSLNPSRGWMWKYVIAPYKKYMDTGVITDHLLCEREPETGKPVLIDGKPILLIELIEGSTYTNSHVLSKDFITTLESAYQGQMKDRFLKGEWGAYEGLVYPQWNDAVHVVKHDDIKLYYKDLIQNRIKISWLEGYDFGIASPSCYLLAMLDHLGNVVIVDGFHKAEFPLEQQAEEIMRIRKQWGVKESSWIYADPDIFRRKSTGGSKLVGKSVSELFFEYQPALNFTRGNNDILNGIVKVSSYLKIYDHHINPFDGTVGAPYLYVSDNVPFVQEEMASYFWSTNSAGEREDSPVDRADHSLDTIKYMLSHKPNAASVSAQAKGPPAYLTQWQEKESTEVKNPHRYG